MSRATSIRLDLKNSVEKHYEYSRGRTRSEWGAYGSMEGVSGEVKKVVEGVKRRRDFGERKRRSQGQAPLAPQVPGGVFNKVKVEKVKNHRGMTTGGKAQDKVPYSEEPPPLGSRVRLVRPAEGRHIR
ncbi:hypothetical protein Tco_0087719 [Tanacetum coccineum]